MPGGSRHSPDRERPPGLLFWQIGVLAAMAGVLATRHLWPGLACFLVVLVGAGRLPPLRFALLAVCFPAGWLYALATAPVAPESLPDWFRPAVYERVTGEVADVSGQPDRRLRVMLRDVRPAATQEEGQTAESLSPAAAKPLPGFVSLSWDQGKHPDQPRPLPGQTVTLTTKLRPVTGFRNDGVNNSTEYWSARDVWVNAWTADSQPLERQARISGDATPASITRERLRASMVTATGGSTPIRNGLAGRNSGAPDKAAGNASGKTSAQAVDQISGATFNKTGDGTSASTQAAAMLPALLFGDRYGLDSSTLDMFIRANLVHSLALSGQHLALAGLAAALFVWLAGLLRPRLFLKVSRRTLLLGLSAPFAALYLWVGNAPISLIRAALMMFFGLLLWIGKRPSTLLDLLFLAALCFLLAWPQALFDLSIQLSMLSVAGIALATPLLRRVSRWPVHKLAGRLVRNATLLFITSLAVQITTLPIVLATFGRVSPLFPLNLLWLPVLELLVMPLTAIGMTLLAFLGPNPVTDALFATAVLPGQGLILLLEFLRDHDGLTVWQGLKPAGLSVVGYAAAVVAGTMVLVSPRDPRVPLSGVAFFRRPLNAAGRLALCAALFLPLGALEREADAWQTVRQARVTLRVLDVGQGQALAVEWPGGRLVLDGGGSFSPRFDTGRDIVAHALTANRPPRLNMVIASHADMDHARGLTALLDLFAVQEFVHSTAPFASDSFDGNALETMRQRRGIPLREMSAGNMLSLGPDLRLEVLHPPLKGRRLSSNNSSLVIRVAQRVYPQALRLGPPLAGQQTQSEGDEWRGLALLCGDAQIPALRALLESGADLRADVLVLPHHGSATSLLPEFYNAVSPRWAIVSRNSYNSFGFPHPDVIQALAERRIPLLDTALHGEIRIVWTPHAPPAVLAHEGEER